MNSSKDVSENAEGRAVDSTSSPGKMLGIPYWIIVVALFFLGWVFMYADRTILNPVMGKLQEEFGLSRTELGLINSVFFFAYALVQIPAGVLGDKIGRKIVLVPGFILFGIFTAVSGWVTSFKGLLVARVITGVGEGTYYGPQYAISNETVPLKYRSLGSAIINSGMAFGIALGLMSSSYLVYDLNMNWHAPFYAFALPTILVGVLIWLVIREKPRARGAAAVQKASLGSLLRNRNLLLTYIMVFCSLFGFFMILTWLPYYLQTERGIAGSQTGFVASLVAWVSIPGALIISSFSDWLGKRKPLVFVLVPIAAAALCSVVYFQSQTALICSLVVYGLFGKLALDPVLVALVADNAPKEGYASAFGVFNCVGMSSSILAPTITGFIAEHTNSLSSGFYISAAILLVGMCCMVGIREKPAAAPSV